jgi:hypothetical protein
MGSLVDGLVDVGSEQDLSLKGGPALPLLLRTAIHAVGLPHLALQRLILHQQPTQLLLLLPQIVLPLTQLVLQPRLLQFVHVPQLLHLLLLQRLQLHPHLLPHLDVLPLGKVLVVQDVDIGHTLRLQVALQLRTPPGEEVVPRTELLVGFLLGLQLTGGDLLLQLVGGLVVRQL